MQTKEELENSILEDIKKVSQKILEVQTPSGLLLYQAEIQKVYENFVLLKALNQNKGIHNSISNKPEQTQVKEEIKEEFKPEAVAIEETKAEKPKNSENEKGKIDFDFNINSLTPEFPKLSMDLNDNIAFLKALFNGDKAELNSFLDGINERDQKSSKAYINHYIEIMEWDSSHEEYIERIISLNNQRFE